MSTVMDMKDQGKELLQIDIKSPRYFQLAFPSTYSFSTAFHKALLYLIEPERLVCRNTIETASCRFGVVVLLVGTDRQRGYRPLNSSTPMNSIKGN